MTTNADPTPPAPLEIQFKSSNLKSARLDPSTGVVEVEFLNGGKYSYGNFSAELMKAWGEAKSGGSWFDANVKKKPERHPLKSSSPAAEDRTPATPAPTPAPAPTPPAPATATPAPAAAATDPAALAVDVRKCDHTTVTEANAFYAAYIANSNGKAWDGRPCPEWKDLGNAVQSHWCAVAIKAKERGLHDADRQALVIDNEELKKKLQQAQGYSKHSLDTAVLERTKTIEEDCSKLRARVAELEDIVKTNDFRPWRTKP